MMATIEIDQFEKSVSMYRSDNNIGIKYRKEKRKNRLIDHGTYIHTHYCYIHTHYTLAQHPIIQRSN